MKDKLALLERAFVQLHDSDIHVTNDNGYLEISPPLLASESTMFGTGQLPKFDR